MGEDLQQLLKKHRAIVGHRRVPANCNEAVIYPMTFQRPDGSRHLLQPFRWRGREVPAGTVVNGASRPGWAFWIPRWGSHDAATFIHDYAFDLLIVKVKVRVDAGSSVKDAVAHYESERVRINREFIEDLHRLKVSRSLIWQFQKGLRYGSAAHLISAVSKDLES